jgi:hypothetical protein
MGSWLEAFSRREGAVQAARELLAEEERRASQRAAAADSAWAALEALGAELLRPTGGWCHGCGRDLTVEGLYGSGHTPGCELAREPLARFCLPEHEPGTQAGRAVFEASQGKPWVVTGWLCSRAGRKLSRHTLLCAARSKNEAEQTAADIICELSADEEGEALAAAWPLYLHVESCEEVGRFWLAYPLRVNEAGELAGAEEVV